VKPRSVARAVALVFALVPGACVVDDSFADAQFKCHQNAGSDECPADMHCDSDGLCRSTSQIAGGGGGGGSPDGCFPATCDKLAPACGALDDGCGNTLDCGCTPPNTCGGGDVLGQCGCHRAQVATHSPDAAFQQTVTGSVAWQNVDNARLSDDQYADTASAMASGKITNLLKVSAFSFALPANAVVTGVQVDIERSAPAGAIKDQEVRVQVGGKPSPNALDKSAAWDTSDASASYGGPSELWGEAEIKVSDVNATDFGVSLTATATASDTPKVDAISITVYFDDPACPP
jgi:hypothetical protein